MRPLAAFLSLCLVLPGCGDGESPPSQDPGRVDTPVPIQEGPTHAERIVACFDAYKHAILSQDGATAVELVSSETVDEYQTYVDMCLDADRATLETLSIFPRFQVLLIKHRVPADSLRTMDGRALFRYAVDHDWIGKKSTIALTVGNAQAAAGRGKAMVFHDGRRTTEEFLFREEQGAWKLDLLKSNPSVDQVLRMQADQSGLGENAFILRVAEALSGRKVADTIWEPLGRE